MPGKLILPDSIDKGLKQINEEGQKAVVAANKAAQAKAEKEGYKTPKPKVWQLVTKKGIFAINENNPRYPAQVVVVTNWGQRYAYDKPAGKQKAAETEKSANDK